MNSSEGRHVFISYVREDADRVDELCKVLEAAQIPYWRDRSSLGPGDAWRAAIRGAIRDGSLVFLACFSDSSRAKRKSYMNEELTLAVDEFRQMPPGRTWLIPVRFDPGEVPEWDLGAGRTLRDLNYSDLFGGDYLANVARLITTIHRLIGEKPTNTATALAAVEQSTDADRCDLIKRLTKDMLLDPMRRIELDELVTNEVHRIASVLNDEETVSGPRAVSNDEFVAHVVREAQALWGLSAPFCASIQVAARWGSPDILAPWANGLRSFVASANRVAGGVQALLELRHLPGMVGIMTAGLACVSSRKWENLRTLVTEPTVRTRIDQAPVPLLEATGLYQPFGTSDWVANTLARATLQDMDPEHALEDFTERRVGKYHTPVSEWLLHILRPLFADQWPDEESYVSEFERAEVMLGVLAQDAANQKSSGSAWTRSYWYGRATWRAAHYHGNAAEDLAHELATQGALWGPLQSGLFGGDPDRARAAVDTYVTNFNKIASQQRF